MTPKEVAASAYADLVEIADKLVEADRRWKAGSPTGRAAAVFNLGILMGRSALWLTRIRGGADFEGLERPDPTVDRFTSRKQRVNNAGDSRDDEGPPHRRPRGMERMD